MRVLKLIFWLITLSLTILLAGENPESGPIRFAWFTDTHVGSPTGAADLGIVVRDVRQRQEAAFVIVSGDISEMDVGSNLMLAKEILDSLGVPYHIIPGNHDTKWSASGAGLFTQLWGADRFNFEVGEYRFIGIHQGPLLRMGDGYMDPDDIAWVDAILKALPDPRQKIFIVMHYPLDPAVDNWYVLRDVIRPYNIQAILHGHGHRNRAMQYEGVPGIMSRSTLRRGTQPTGYTLVDLFEDRAEFYERLPLSDSLHHWHSLALGERDYSDSLTLADPDYTHNLGSGVKLVWQQSTGAIITSAASVDAGQLIATNTRGTVYAYDLATGHERWTWQGTGAIHATPAIGKGRVVFGSTDSTITCLDLATGALKWQHKTTGPILGSPVIFKKQLYIGSGDGVFRALDLKSGRVRWEYGEIGGYIETRPLLAEGRVMFGAWDGAFYALDMRRGTLIWRWSDGPQGLLYSPAACWPVASQGKVFIVAPDRVMTAIDQQTGKTIWREAGHKVRETLGISEDGRSVYARTMQDTTFAIDPASPEFKLRWIQNTGFDYDIAPNAMIEKGGHVFLSTDNGWVYCLDSADGRTLWRYRISDGLVNTPTPISGNSVVCTAVDGRVSLLRYEGP